MESTPKRNKRSVKAEEEVFKQSYIEEEKESNCESS